MSAFGGKADMTFALHMSAYDPERTSLFIHVYKPIPCFAGIGGTHEAAGIYWCVRRGGRLATTAHAHRKELPASAFCLSAAPNQWDRFLRRFGIEVMLKVVTFNS